MNIYLVWQNKNEDYDTYDSFVVIAETKAEAKRTHPSGVNKDATQYHWVERKGWHDEEGKRHNSDTWVNDLEHIHVELIGEATIGQLRKVVCASFNAG